jgi:2-phospho-L-lactate/phosphoenolpyruvate guanylyltransferase
VKIQAVIPVKPFHLAKSRLASVFTAEQRAACSTWMLTHTLECLRAASEIEAVIVISRDQHALTLAEHFRATALLEKQPGLNLALQQAAAFADSSSALLVLPADLPLLTAADLQQFVRLLGDPPEVILAPDRHCQGTNALLLNPNGAYQFCFGWNSLHAHQEQARRLGMHFKIHQSFNLAFDLDLPEDIEIFRNQER